MRLTLREKQTFYHELEKFLRSGIAMPQAVDALIPDLPRGAVREVLTRMRQYFRESETVPGAFARLQPVIGEMEVTMISSSSESGKLDKVMAYLSEYFGTLHEVRSNVIGQLTWPVIQLHIAVFVASAPSAFLIGPGAYVLVCARTFAIIYSLAAVAVVLVWGVMRLAHKNVGIDRALRFLPLIGKLRRNFALSRFCATFEMQLQAGINVMNSLTAAAKASHSVTMQADAERAVPRILNGAQIATAMEDASSLPPSFRRVLRIGEDTGSLDQDLRQWADYYQKAAITSLKRTMFWLQRFVYLLIFGYFIYEIFAMYNEAVLSPMKTLLQD